MPELPRGRWIRGTQICPCDFGVKRSIETRGRAVLCELLFHPAPAIQASHRPSYTPGLLKHGKSGLFSALESELCPKFLQHSVLGNCLHHSIAISAALLGYFASGIAASS